MLVYQLGFEFQQNRTGRDTFKEEHHLWTFKKILDTTNTRGTTALVARSSKAILTRSTI